MISTTNQATTQFNCLHCNQQLRVDASIPGQTVRCGACGKCMTVPEPVDVFEERASDWISQDVEELWQKDDDLIMAGAPSLQAEHRAPQPIRFPTPQPHTPPTRPAASSKRANMICHNRLPDLFAA